MIYYEVVRIVAVLLVIGVVLYLVERFIPMSEPVKIIMRVVVVVALIVCLLRALGGLL